MRSVTNSFALTLVATLALLTSGCPEVAPVLDTGPIADGGAMDVGQQVDVGRDVFMGERCTNDMECSDNMYCNGQERCLGGVCAAGTDPCDDRATCTEDTCSESADDAGQHCGHLRHDEMCGDRNACNGVERCAPGTTGTMPGTGCQVVRPENFVDCDDSNNCTLDACDPTTGCFHGPRDLDGDGHVDRMCTLDGTPTGPGGDDCNDGDPVVYPGAREVCDNSRDDNCDGRTDYADTATCSPANDTCATATVLPGPGTYWGSNIGLTNDYALGCNTPGAFVDAVFQFTTTEARDVTISASTGAANSAVALVEGCTPFVERRCNRSAGSTAPSIRYRSLPAGTHRIVVETGSITAAFRLTLRLDPPTPPIVEDTCPGTEPNPAVELNDGMPHVASLSTLEDDYLISCDAFTPHRDAVYRLTLTAPSDVTITAVPPVTPFSTTYMSFRNSPCPINTSERRCTTGSGSVGASLSQRNLPAGTYWLIVENSTEANVTVRAMISPPAARVPGDACPGIAVPTDGSTVSVPFATLLPGSDVGTSCGTGVSTSASWRDAIFSFTLTAPRDVVVNATRVGTGTAYMQVFSACGAAGSALGACVSTSTTPGSRRLAGLAAGTYYVVVDSSSTTVTSLAVNITATDPALRPAIEACTGTLVPTDDSPFTVAWGTTGTAGAIGAGPDHGTSCGSNGTSALYRDAVLRYTLTAPQDVQISITNPSGTSLYADVRSTCSDLRSTVSPCQFVSAGTIPMVRRIRSQPAGTYFIVLETPTAAAMNTTVRISATTPTATVTYVPTMAPAGVSFVNICTTIPHGTVLPNIDDASTIIPAVGSGITIPFPMRVYGLAVPAAVAACTNGWISFTSTTTASLGGSIPSPSDPNLTVAGFWTDLVTRAGGICYGVTGTAPNRKFIVQWDDTSEYPTRTGNITFEIVVNEAPVGANNIIDVIYQQMDGLTRTAVAGIENEDGTLGTSILAPFTAPRVVRLTPTP